MQEVQMGEMVERVALAIATLSADAGLRHNLAEINQSDRFEEYRRMWPVKVTDHDKALARAAIEAMREPTKEMIDACDINIPTEGEIVGVWDDMISAALK
jgi:hypothetical protein